MAHPRELVRKVSEVLGVPEATVIQLDRNLASRGYRRKGGRGRSAIHVSPEDAANLLIAVAAAPVTGPMVKDTVANFENYASLPAWTHSGERGDWCDLGVLRELPKGHSLGAAITALIRGYARGDFATFDQVRFGKAVSTEDPGTISVAVELHGPIPEAHIRIRGHKCGPDGEPTDSLQRELAYDERFGDLEEVENLADIEYPPGHPKAEWRSQYERVPSRVSEKVEQWLQRRATLYGTGDLGQIRIFTDVTLEAVAELFRHPQPRVKN